MVRRKSTKYNLQNVQSDKCGEIAGSVVTGFLLSRKKEKCPNGSLLILAPISFRTNGY